MGTNQQQNPNTPAAEIWKILKELSEDNKDLKKRMKETAQSIKETDRQVKETAQSIKETDRQMKKTDRQMKETDRQMQRTDKRINKLGGRFDEQWGSLVESLVEGKIITLLQSRGIKVINTFTRATGFYWVEEDGVRRKRNREIDIIASNGSEVVAVEVKTTLRKGDIKYFLNTLKDFRKYFYRYKTETIYGAIAYLKSKKEISDFAEKEGLFVIRATGDSASLINQKDFKPRAF